MKKESQSLVKKLINKNKEKNIFRGVIGLISFIAMLLTVCLFTSPAMTLTENASSTLHLIDSHDYSWKENLTTSYDLKLHFIDTKGNYIEGEDVTIDIGPNGLKDDPYGFGTAPSNRGLDVIKELKLDEYVLPTGEKYEFDHAEVYVDGTWRTFSKTSDHWDIWCQSASSEDSTTNYGWRGKYGENVGYTITEDTEYKFVYKLVRYGTDHTVTSLGSDYGITFNLFNYSGNNGQTGENNINNNGLFPYFTFRDSNRNEEIVSTIKPETDEDGFTDNRAKVEPKLQNGYPVFDCRGYCTNKSLGYLFGASTNPNGVAPIGVTKYQALNTPLQKGIINGVEYYYYDSKLNAVDYDTENNRFLVRDYQERGYTMATQAKEGNRYEFMPFNYLNPDSTLKKYSNTGFQYNYEEEDVDHWYGMTMEFSFYMPKDGMINGNDMIFEFSGDDDVWVFVDDVLVLDLGGTHGATDGSINFKTGEVEAFLNWNGKVGTKNKTTIYDSFFKAKATEDVEWNSSNTTFEDYTKHTIKFFYLERGAAVANCKIRFNIPVLPSGSVSVKKEYEGINKYIDDTYEFTLYDTTNGSSIPVTNVNYTINGVTATTDSNGHFNLKENEVAIFKLNNFHKYYVEETNSGIHSISHSCSLNDNECQSINQTGEFIINPDSTHQVIFKNKIKTFNLNVSKIAYGSSDNEIFTFRLNLTDSAGNIVDIPDDIDSPNKYSVNHDSGIVTYNLKSGENVVIKDIPIDTIVNLEEVKHDGYTVVIKSGDVILAEGDSYQFTMDANKDITVHNIPGVTLPETGGSGIWTYLIVGISLILISIKYGYNHLLSTKGGE